MRFIKNLDTKAVYSWTELLAEKGHMQECDEAGNKVAIAQEEVAAPVAKKLAYSEPEAIVVPIEAPVAREQAPAVEMPEAPVTPEAPVMPPAPKPTPKKKASKKK